MRTSPLNIFATFVPYKAPIEPLQTPQCLGRPKEISEAHRVLHKENPEKLRNICLSFFRYSCVFYGKFMEKRGSKAP